MRRKQHDNSCCSLSHCISPRASTIVLKHRTSLVGDPPRRFALFYFCFSSLFFVNVLQKWVWLSRPSQSVYSFSIFTLATAHLNILQKATHLNIDTFNYRDKKNLSLISLFHITKEISSECLIPPIISKCFLAKLLHAQLSSTDGKWKLWNFMRL